MSGKTKAEEASEEAPDAEPKGSALSACTPPLFLPRAGLLLLVLRAWASEYVFIQYFQIFLIFAFHKLLYTSI